MRPFHPVVQAALDGGVTVKVGWKLGDPKIRSEAEALWERLNMLPKGVDPQTRADEIIAAAYVEGEMAGVATAYMDTVWLVGQRFAMWRCAVAPEFRRHHVMRALGGYSLSVMEQWSLENPDEKIMGLASVTENDALNAAKLPGVIQSAALMLIGYTAEGGRIRVSWFEHARV
jgi:hypothetical protein